MSPKNDIINIYILDIYNVYNEYSIIYLSERITKKNIRNK
jgi:hypothetical protein